MLDFFSTLPGILIICGVILLVIAVALLISENKKGKQKNMSSSGTTSVNNSSNLGNETVPIKETTIEKTPIMMTQEKVDTPNAIAENIPSFVVEPKESVKPSYPIPENIEKETSVSREENIGHETVVNIEEPTPIQPTYNEVNPSYNVQPEPKPVTIYGGNDPLEATQALPKVDVHHKPYSGEYKEVKVVEPMTLNIPEPVESIHSISSVGETNSTFMNQSTFPTNHQTKMPNDEFVVDIPSATQTNTPSETTKSTIEEL